MAAFGSMQRPHHSVLHLMAPFTQDNRPLTFRVLNPKLDANALLIESLTGFEAVSALYDFQLDLLAPKPVDFDQVLNQLATVTRTGPGGRRFHGIIRSLE